MSSEFTERVRKPVRNPGNIDLRRKENFAKNGRTGVQRSGVTRTQLPSDIKRNVDRAISELRVKTNRDSIRITLKDKQRTDKNPSDRFKSKFGGTPYWPKSMTYPSYNGKPMYMLAQINFSEMPRLAGYPTSGILQFFALDMDYFDNDKRCKVVYHPTVDKRAEQIDIPVTTIGVDVYDGNLPLGDVYFFDKCTLEKVCIQPSCDNFKKELQPILDKYVGNIDQNLRWDIDNYIYDQISAWGHRIGGWPNFTQNDMMSNKYNRLLLQIDSDYKKGIQWGDCGIGNIFINDQALGSKNFKDCLCTWDCC